MPLFRPKRKLQGFTPEQEASLYEMLSQTAQDITRLSTRDANVVINTARVEARTNQFLRVSPPASGQVLVLPPPNRTVPGDTVTVSIEGAVGTLTISVVPDRDGTGQMAQGTINGLQRVQATEDGLVEFTSNGVDKWQAPSQLIGSVSDSGSSTSLRGATGATGATGTAGKDGQQGDKGDDGEQGIQGPQGDKGPKGDQGPPGIEGPQGNDGDPGLKGDKGDKGDRGDQGPAGSDGIDGQDGNPGAVGPTGPKGDQGVAGADGQDGVDGVPGTPGATGATGDQGIPGPAGPPGAAGEDGQDGSPGVPGSIGPTGATGATGGSGAQGAAGPPGADGEGGTEIPFTATPDLATYVGGTLVGRRQEIDLVQGSNVTLTPSVVGGRPTVTIAASTSGGSGVVATVAVNLGSLPRWSGTFDITGLVGLTLNQPVFVQTGINTSSPDESEESISCSGYAFSTTVIRVYWESVNGPVGGTRTFHYILPSTAVGFLSVEQNNVSVVSGASTLNFADGRGAKPTITDSGGGEAQIVINADDVVQSYTTSGLSSNVALNTNTTVLRVDTGNNDWMIDGLTGGFAGRKLKIMNASNSSSRGYIIPGASSASSAGNTITTQFRGIRGGQNYSAYLEYDGTDSFWRIISDTASEWQEQEVTSAGPADFIRTVSDERHLVGANSAQVITGASAGIHCGDMIAISHQGSGYSELQDNASGTTANRFTNYANKNVRILDDEVAVFLYLDNAPGGTVTRQWANISHRYPFCNVSDNAAGDAIVHNGIDWVVASGAGSTVNFLRGDGVFAAPPSPPNQLGNPEIDTANLLWLDEDFDGPLLGAPVNSPATAGNGVEIQGKNNWRVSSGSAVAAGGQAFRNQGTVGHHGVIELATDTTSLRKACLFLPLAIGSSVAHTSSVLTISQLEGIEFWIYIPIITNIVVMCGVGDQPSTATGQTAGANALNWMFVPASFSDFRAFNSASSVDSAISSTGVTVNAGQWYRMGIKYSSLSVEYYINGALEAVVSSNVPVNNASPYVSVQTLTAANRSVYIDRCRIWYDTGGMQL